MIFQQHSTVLGLQLQIVLKGKQVYFKVRLGEDLGFQNWICGARNGQPGHREQLIPEASSRSCSPLWWSLFVGFLVLPVPIQLGQHVPVNSSPKGKQNSITSPRNDKQLKYGEAAAKYSTVLTLHQKKKNQIRKINGVCAYFLKYVPCFVVPSSLWCNECTYLSGVTDWRPYDTILGLVSSAGRSLPSLVHRAVQRVQNTEPLTLIFPLASY